MDQAAAIAIFHAYRMGAASTVQAVAQWLEIEMGIW
jgi:hypothetical protein